MVINRMKTTKTRQGMKLRYIYILLTLIPLLYLAPANAQTKKPAAKKTVKKAATKTAPAKKPTSAQKTDAKNFNAFKTRKKL